METQVVTVAYLWSIYCMQRGTQWQKGLSLGFTMLARPDAAIWVTISCAVELWRVRKRAVWRDLVPVFSGMALLYGPWLIFTFLYYGSPVPNTILAKSMGYPNVRAQLAGLTTFTKILMIVIRLFSVIGSLGPGYAGNGTGILPVWDHGLITLLMTLLLLAGAITALRRQHSDALLLYLFVVSYSLYLIFLANHIFGWYTAPIAATAVIGSLYGLWHLLELFTTESVRERVAGWIGLAYLTALVSVLPVTMHSDKYIQQYVESGGRKQIGLYLASVSLPTDTIASESLGYVAYYSRRTIYDYPGLCSRKVVEYLRDHPHERNLISMMRTLQPTYLVLRPIEYEDADGQIRYRWIKQDYELIRVFKVPEEARRKILHSESNLDFEFDVFRAKRASSRAPL